MILIDWFKPHLVPMNMPLYRVAYFANGNDVSTVLVNGRVLMRDGEVLSVNEDGGARAGRTGGEGRDRGAWGWSASRRRRRGSGGGAGCRSSAVRPSGRTGVAYGALNGYAPWFPQSASSLLPIRIRP